MTQKDKKLNCLNCRIGDFKHSLCDCHNGFCAKYKGIGKQEDFFMAVEALQAESTHGRLIDADALMEYCSNQKSKTISNNDIARFPTVSADRPHGEWIDKGDYAVCSECGGSSGTQYDGVERIPRITAFCPHCGVRMKVNENRQRGNKRERIY